MTTRFRKEDLSRLGRLLQHKRIEAGTTLRELATRSGVSIGAIRAMEGGRSNPSLGTVLAVVEALGLSLDRMVDAVRSGRPRVAAVTRVGQTSAAGDSGLADAVLSATVLTLPSGNLRRAAGEVQRHPSFGMVIAGEVLATTAAGDRVRLGVGDSYHAQSAQLQALAGGGAAPARLLQVIDLRPGPGRPPHGPARGDTPGGPDGGLNGPDHSGAGTSGPSNAGSSNSGPSNSRPSANQT